MDHFFMLASEGSRWLLNLLYHTDFYFEMQNRRQGLLIDPPHVAYNGI